MNNQERSQWIDNDEGLYRWFLSSHMSKVKFIQENKEEIDQCINNVLNGTKRAHYLVYG